jgi:hypothetical protein
MNTVSDYQRRRRREENRHIGHTWDEDGSLMIILLVGPDVLRIDVGGRRATLPGTGMPSLDDIDFQVDHADISHWEDGTAIPDAIREEIVANLPALAAAQRVHLTISGAAAAATG